MIHCDIDTLSGTNQAVGSHLMMYEGVLARKVELSIRFPDNLRTNHSI